MGTTTLPRQREAIVQMATTTRVEICRNGDLDVVAAQLSITVDPSGASYDSDPPTVEFLWEEGAKVYFGSLFMESIGARGDLPSKPDYVVGGTRTWLVPRFPHAPHGCAAPMEGLHVCVVARIDCKNEIGKVSFFPLRLMDDDCTYMTNLNGSNGVAVSWHEEFK